MAERNQRNRRRCLMTGCNPILQGDEQAMAHANATGHRTAAWPIRSPAGKAKARTRNRTGYYDRYNVGAKSAEVRGIGHGGTPVRDHDGGLFFSSHSQDGDDE